MSRRIWILGNNRKKFHLHRLRSKPSHANVHFFQTFFSILEQFKTPKKIYATFKLIIQIRSNSCGRTAWNTQSIFLWNAFPMTKTTTPRDIFLIFLKNFPPCRWWSERSDLWPVEMIRLPVAGASYFSLKKSCVACRYNSGRKDPHHDDDNFGPFFSGAKGFVQSKEMENLSIKDAAIDERVVAPPSVNVLTGNTFW